MNSSHPTAFLQTRRSFKDVSSVPASHDLLERSLSASVITVRTFLDQCNDRCFHARRDLARAANEKLFEGEGQPEIRDFSASSTRIRTHLRALVVRLIHVLFVVRDPAVPGTGQHTHHTKYPVSTNTHS